MFMNLVDIVRGAGDKLGRVCVKIINKKGIEMNFKKIHDGS